MTYCCILMFDQHHVVLAENGRLRNPAAAGPEGLPRVLDRDGAPRRSMCNHPRDGPRSSDGGQMMSALPILTENEERVLRVGLSPGLPQQPDPRRAVQHRPGAVPTRMDEATTLSAAPYMSAKNVGA